MFRTAYDSAWQHPGIAWIAGLACLLVGASWPRGRWRSGLWWSMFLLLEVEIVVDAWMTGAFCPLGAKAAEVAAIVFVIVGDLRFFYFIWLVRLVRLDRVDSSWRARSWMSALAVAIPVSLIVPVSTAVLHAVNPERYRGTLLFLLYEIGLVVVATGFARYCMRSADAEIARYQRRLWWLELTQYGVWVIADTLILAGVDAGWLLRIVPNALYYVAFAPVATWGVPAEVRA